MGRGAVEGMDGWLYEAILLRLGEEAAERGCPDHRIGERGSSRAVRGSGVLGDV